MSAPKYRRNRRPLTRWDYHSLQVIYLCLVLIGPALIFYAKYAEHRDRPSLQWPKVSGKVMLCEEVYHAGSLHGAGPYHSVAVSYTYVVNGRRYVGRRIALWSADLHGGRTREFVAAHPAHLAVDVYYEPQHPDNAVLIPGPDAAGNRRFIRAGGIAFLGGLLMVFMGRTKLATVKAAVLSAEAKRASGEAEAAGLPNGFASYEPDSKRKLNVFPDRECLDEVLGHRGAPLQEWKPEDRVIDTAGREYRLVKEPGKKRYNLNATGQTWSYEQLLDAAEADGRLLKKDPKALRRRLNDVRGDKRMAVLLKSIDDLPTGPRWVVAGLLLFLLLFFLAVMFTAGMFFTWLIKLLP